MEQTQNVDCIVKKVVVEYFVAVTPEGKEVKIEGVDEEKLTDGMTLTGTLCSEDVQDVYSDGSYSRSYTTKEWLEVIEK